jgi:RND family efflux transporter MFP subunit
VLTAEFRPFQEVDVHAKVAGYLKKIYVDVGDRVQQGQLLAVLEIPEMADDMQRARASTQLSSANVRRAQDELERARSAHELAHLSYTRLAEVIKQRPNLVAQQEIDNAAGSDRVSEAQVSAAQAALDAAGHQVSVSEADQQKVQTLNDYAKITAPFAGVVTNRYADTGAMIQAGTASQTQAMPVIKLSQNDLLRLVLPVPESVVPRIRLGDTVEVRVPTLNRSFQGRIARFSGKVSTATRTMETEVDVPNPGLVLFPGMYAEAVLTLERKPDAVAVPLEAVRDDSVLVVTPSGSIEERKVKTGIETPTDIEILSGLAPGELVIVGTRSQFRPGQRVQPKLPGA